MCMNEYKGVWRNIKAYEGMWRNMKECESV